MDLDRKRKLEAYKAAAAEHKAVTDNTRPKNDTKTANGRKPQADDWRITAEAIAKVPENAPGGSTNRNKAQNVAKFLILIGQEQAAKVLANLDEEQVESITREITGIKGVTKEEASEVFAEFQGLLSASGGASGGLEEARRLLYAAFGPEKGETLLRRSLPDTKETIFDFLEDFSGEQIATLLKDELPAAGAMILSRVSPKLAARTLSCSEPEWRLETARRIGRLGRISPEALEKTAVALREKARKIGGEKVSDVDGMGALAAILKHSSVSFGDKMLRELSDEDADLGGRLRERLYTTDDVIAAPDKPIQEKLQRMDVRDIALLVKGRNDGFAEKILSNISSRRRSEVDDELSFMGPVLKKDVDAVIKEFMEWFRKECESGQIVILDDEMAV
ncbi:MAG: flagellar motor switch protein FliG [Spirochaetaceae bacterium]|jgi:flagellar motor switch protein FliG|nr:flagellar motor switch protein FliG [Spirochaetaceae bacterium]